MNTHTYLHIHTYSLYIYINQIHTKCIYNKCTVKYEKKTCYPSDCSFHDWILKWGRQQVLTHRCFLRFPSYEAIGSMWMEFLPKISLKSMVVNVGTYPGIWTYLLEKGTFQSMMFLFPFWWDMCSFPGGYIFQSPWSIWEFPPPTSIIAFCFTSAFLARLSSNSCCEFGALTSGMRMPTSKHRKKHSMYLS